MKYTSTAMSMIIDYDETMRVWTKDKISLRIKWLYTDG